MGELDGRVAIVTGCGRERGIGRACALALAREGAAVVVSDVCREFEPNIRLHGVGTWEQLERLAEEIRSDGGKAHAVRCDVTRKDEVEELVAETLRQLGHVDILVNNAGCAVGVGPLPIISEEAWDKTMAVNVKGPFLLTQAAAPHMIARGGGKVIMMSSQAGVRAGARYGAYGASKHALVGLTQVLGAELAPEGIQVNAICPGLVDTDLGFEQYAFLAGMQGSSVDEVRAELLKSIPAGRFETPEDVANVCVFLASSRSDYLVGQALVVTGGYTR
ncbi:MAG: SDR family oxidoreductase [Myxococcota bacterium]|nr:SDR family oxidoreductase [Myxococcota bacterium]